MQQVNETLSFSLGGNAKLAEKTASFSLPAGHACPGAYECLAKADRETGRITDGKHATTRCFMASLEAAFKSVRDRNWRNFNLVRAARTRDNIKRLILGSLPDMTKWEVMRIHVAGDFYNLSYFMAWVDVARHHDSKLFYAYTTSGHLFAPFLEKEPEGLPENFVLTGSMAGRYTEEYDKLVKHRASIAYHPEDTDLPIDHDDSHAMSKEEGDFALLVHGGQPANSDAGRAISRLKQEGVRHSYPSGRRGKQKEAATA